MITAETQNSQGKKVQWVSPKKMEQLTKEEKDKIISRLFWDVDMGPVNAGYLIQTHLQSIQEVHSQQFFRKLLTSCDWYTLQKLVPAEKLKLILDDAIIDGLFPQDLKMKYKYARDLLSG